MRSLCYILSYYSPDYVRTRTLLQGLRRLEDIKLYEARNTTPGAWRYFQTIWKLLKIRVMHNPQLYLLGFRGYEHFWIVRLITAGKTLIFDHMMSPYDSLVNERKSVRKGGVLDRIIHGYERRILQAADIVLADTESHQRYFEEIFALPRGKIHAIPVAADEALFVPASSQPQPADKDFEILFYGSFLPLHGIEVILQAAASIRDLPIRLHLIGGSRRNLSDFYRRIEQLDLQNVYHTDWVDFEQLPRIIARAQVGLGGPFGNTGQARRVITGKTFQFLAMAKAVIVGQIDQECGFVDKMNCLLVPQGDPEALAEAIAWAFNHKFRLKDLGQAGYKLYHSRFSVEQAAVKLREILPE